MSLSDARGTWVGGKREKALPAPCFLVRVALSWSFLPFGSISGHAFSCQEHGPKRHLVWGLMKSEKEEIESKKEG